MAAKSTAVRLKNYDDDAAGAKPASPRRVNLRRASILCVCLSALPLSAGRAAAQDLEPRAYSALPVGVNFVVVAAGRSSGGVVVDPSLPIEDVEASVGTVSVGYGRTFKILDRTALIVAALPYARVKASGRVSETETEVSRSGLADPRIKLSINLTGGAPQNPRDFARAPRRTIVGASIAMAPPLGQYYPDKLINLGANRWSFKPEIGLSHAVGKWTLEGYGGVLLFTTNEEFYPGSAVRTQKPVVAVQGHVSYAFTARVWTALNATFYTGGRTGIDGVAKADLQRNSRLGATLSLPIVRQQSLKIAMSTGATTRIGADFKTLTVAWQLTWFD
jgi:hypothetical protein